MTIVKVADLVPDMVLASDIINFEGRFLLPAGVALTERSIGMLKAWGVVEATIQNDGHKEHCQGQGSVDPDALAAARKINEDRFRHVDSGHPVMKELESLSSLRKARAIQRGVLERRPYFIEEKQQHSDDDQEPLPVINPSAVMSYIGNRLPMLPAVFNKINETIMNPNSSAVDMAAVISQDSGLTYQLLGLVNSSFYGFVSKIDTVSRAVAIVGTRQLTNLVFGISMIKFFENIPPRHVDMKGFWKHCIACGITARIIAGYNNIQNTERLFVAGLLHDIGRLLMFRMWPEHSRRALVKARQDLTLLHQAEAELMGVDHAVIGARMAEHWRLPFLLETTIRNHHIPKASHNRLEASIVHLADIIVNAMEMGSSGEMFVPSVDEDAWNSLGLSTGLLSVIINHVDGQFDETIMYFFPDAPYAN